MKESPNSGGYQPSEAELTAADAYVEVLRRRALNPEKFNQEQRAHYERLIADYNTKVALCGLTDDVRQQFEQNVANGFHAAARERERRENELQRAKLERSYAKPPQGLAETPQKRTVPEKPAREYKYDHRPLLEHVMRVIDDAGIELSKTERDVMTVGLLYFGEEMWPSKEVWAQALKKETGRGSVSTIWYALHGRYDHPGLIGKRILTERRQTGRTARGTTPPTIYNLNPFRFPAKDRPKG